MNGELNPQPNKDCNNEDPDEMLTDPLKSNERSVMCCGGSIDRSSARQFGSMSTIQDCDDSGFSLSKISSSDQEVGAAVVDKKKHSYRRETISSRQRSVGRATSVTTGDHHFVITRSRSVSKRSKSVPPSKSKKENISRRRCSGQVEYHRSCQSGLIPKVKVNSKDNEKPCNRYDVNNSSNDSALYDVNNSSKDSALSKDSDDSLHYLSQISNAVSDDIVQVSTTVNVDYKRLPRTCRSHPSLLESDTAIEKNKATMERNKHDNNYDTGLLDKTMTNNNTARPSAHPPARPPARPFFNVSTQIGRSAFTTSSQKTSTNMRSPKKPTKVNLQQNSTEVSSKPKPREIVSGQKCRKISSEQKSREIVSGQKCREIVSEQKSREISSGQKSGEMCPQRKFKEVSSQENSTKGRSQTKSTNVSLQKKSMAVSSDLKSVEEISQLNVAIRPSRPSKKSTMYKNPTPSIRLMNTGSVVSTEAASAPTNEPTTGPKARRNGFNPGRKTSHNDNTSSTKHVSSSSRRRPVKKYEDCASPSYEGQCHTSTKNEYVPFCNKSINKNSSTYGSGNSGTGIQKSSLCENELPNIQFGNSFSPTRSGCVVTYDISSRARSLTPSISRNATLPIMTKRSAQFFNRTADATPRNRAASTPSHASSARIYPGFNEEQYVHRSQQHKSITFDPAIYHVTNITIVNNDNTVNNHNTVHNDNTVTHHEHNKHISQSFDLKNCTGIQVGDNNTANVNEG